ncbi:MAG: hypothetical protein AAFY41_11915, partial [Bacteroidota bacterium]
ESSSLQDSESGPSFDFKDQILQGQIDGFSFEYGEGTVSILASPSDGNNLFFDLYDIKEDFTDICDFIGFGDEVSVFFRVPNEVGLYELDFDLSSFDGQVITLFNPEGSVNNIASIGALEILTISDTLVTGRMDARLDSENTVNGNFSAVFCTEN